MRKHENLIKNFLLLISVVFIFLFAIEIILKINFQDTTFGAGVGPNSLKFNVENVHLNLDDMRDRDFSIDKPDKTIRIAGLGDSYTFASGIKNVNNSYLKVLENELNSLNNSNRYEVLNFGIPGKDTEDELEILEEKVLKYDPDVIMIGYVLNDFKNVDPTLKLPKKHITIIPYFGFWLSNLFYSYTIFEIKMNRALENTGLKMSTTEITFKEFESDINKNYNRELFEKIAKIAKENDIKVVLIVFPVIYDFENYPFLEINSFIKKVGEDNGFYTIDILESYKKYEESTLIVNKYDLHPNELGHKIAGEAILEIFINNSLML
ncbi:MAG: SGNH/GDSL hydrolase family protein [Nanoarchaeota archaeon]|nr:SGNH/GDSL hydrolase family protein [Nanoarchaeota archaeon]